MGQTENETIEGIYTQNILYSQLDRCQTFSEFRHSQYSLYYTTVLVVSHLPWSTFEHCQVAFFLVPFSIENHWYSCRAAVLGIYALFPFWNVSGNVFYSVTDKIGVSCVTTMPWICLFFDEGSTATACERHCSTRASFFTVGFLTTCGFDCDCEHIRPITGPWKFARGGICRKKQCGKEHTD